MLKKDFAEAHNLLGVAYDRKGFYKLAQDSYKTALRFNRKNARTLNNLGYSFYLAGDYRSAVKQLKTAVKFAPDDQRILNNLGLALFRNGKPDEAFRAYARAGGEFKGHLNVAAMLVRFGQKAEAIKHYESARRLQPASTLVLETLAKLYRETGRGDEAGAVRQEIEKLSTQTMTATAVQ